MQSVNSTYPSCKTPGAFELGFCTIAIVSENVAEIVVHEGVEVSGAMVEQCFSVLRTFLRTPFCLLVNECNSHSYDFAAQTALGAVDGLLAVALVSDKPLMDMAACSLMRLPRPTRWPMAVFSNREDALALLNALHRGNEERPRTVENFPRALSAF